MTWFTRKRWQKASSVSRLVAVLTWLVAAGIAFFAGMSQVFGFYIEPMPGQSAWNIVAFGIMMLALAGLLVALGVGVLDDRLSWKHGLVFGTGWGAAAAVLTIAVAVSPADRLSVWVPAGLLLIVLVHRSTRVLAVALAVWIWLTGVLGLVAWLLFAPHIPA